MWMVIYRRCRWPVLTNNSSSLYELREKVGMILIMNELSRLYSGV